MKHTNLTHTIIFFLAFSLLTGCCKEMKYEYQPGAAPAAKPLTYNLWPSTPPGPQPELPPEQDVTKPTDRLIAGHRIIKLANVTTPQLDIYKPDPAIDTGTAVVIAPGGGHHILAYDLEGTEVAAWFNSIGVTGIVLKYRVPGRAFNKDARHIPAVQDAQRAMSLVRSKAKELNINPRKIGILGFSAGTDPVKYTALTDKRLYTPIDDHDKKSYKPNFAIPIYAAYGMPEGANLTTDTPPFFMVIAHDDADRAIRLAQMYIELKKADVSAELHIYESGGHGYGLRPTDAPVTTWPQRLHDWMKRLNLLEMPKTN